MSAQFKIKADDENNAEKFWSIFSDSHVYLADQIRVSGEAFVTAEDWREIQEIEGFSDGPEHARNALLVVPSLDYIVCPIAEDDETIEPEIATRFAESLGWDATDAVIVHQHPAEIGTWLASTGNRKSVRDPEQAWAQQSLANCLVMTWEDYHETV